MPSLDSFKSRKTLTVGAKTYAYYSLEAAAQNGLGDISRLPVSLKVLLENLLRFEDGGFTVSSNDVKAVVDWQKDPSASNNEIQYRPARVLLQDFTGVPLLVDLAAMRSAEAMLAAERRLQQMIKEGKIEGLDKIVTFDELSAWPYEDGLKGMPKRIKELERDLLRKDRALAETAALLVLSKKVAAIYNKGEDA